LAPPANAPASLSAKSNGIAKQYPADAYASRVPPDPGLYRVLQDAVSPIDIKMLLGESQGGGLGKVLKKSKTVAYLVGSASKTSIQASAPIFYMRLPEGKGIEEVLLVAFERKDDRREIEMGSKQELKASAIKQFDALEVGPRLMKITPANLAKGEYLFYVVGSADPPKGNCGKGYDFGIVEPSKRK
jgi:hypothetical protein